MSRRGWILFVAMGVIWGIPYLLIKVAVEELAPSTLVLARTFLAVLLLLPVAIAWGQIRPVLTRWQPLLLFAVVEICIPWLLLGYAEQRLSSSLTGLLVAPVPLVAAVLVRYAGPAHEALGRQRLAGLLLGFAGVAALVGFEADTRDVRSVVAVGVVVVCYAVGPMILDRTLADMPGLGVIALSLVVTTVIYAPFGIAEAPGEWPSGKTIAAVVGLAVVCTAVAFVLFFQLIAEVGPARSVVITYVNPAVAVLLGVILLDEPFTAATALGFILILSGSFLATRPSAARVSRRAAADLDCTDIARPVAEP